MSNEGLKDSGRFLPLSPPEQLFALLELFVEVSIR